MFKKIAFANHVLRSLASSQMEKEALQSISDRAVGLGKRVGGAIVHNPLRAGMVGLSAYGAYLAGRAGWSRHGAYMTGFDPAVQAWQSHQVGGDY